MRYAAPPKLHLSQIRALVELWDATAAQCKFLEAFDGE
jgi:hypothetical protein